MKIVQFYCEYFLLVGIFIRAIIAFWSSSDVEEPRINIDFDFDSLQFVLNFMQVATTRFSLINEYCSRMSNDFLARKRMFEHIFPIFGLAFALWTLVIMNDVPSVILPITM